MGEKYYKPILKEGEHLIHSKENPDRVRGLARDEDNKNQDIIEWEEYTLDDLNVDDYMFPDEEYRTQLTPLQEEIANKIADALVQVAVDVGTWAFHELIVPMWKESIWPKIQEKGRKLKGVIRKNKDERTKELKDYRSEVIPAHDMGLGDVSAQIDIAFEQLYYEMDEEEVKAHMMQLVYHMLGLANEVRILSNAMIRKECESDDLCLEKQRDVELFLAGKVANGLDKLLSDGNLRLNIDTSRDLFMLTGGGVRLDGEYVPVQIPKICEAIKKMKVDTE